MWQAAQVSSLGATVRDLTERTLRRLGPKGTTGARRRTVGSRDWAKATASEETQAKRARFDLLCPGCVRVGRLKMPSRTTDDIDHASDVPTGVDSAPP